MRLISRVAALHALVGVGAALFAANVAALPVVPAEPVVVSDTNDVMNGQMPKMPTFRKLAKKPGYLRGFVKDTRGRPLEGAYVMARSSAVGGFGTGATGETDENGYYEVKVPYGAAEVWCAGYAVTYNGVRIANTLLPADGKNSNFVSTTGSVENFVWAPYGVVNEATANDNPGYSGAYMGAALSVGWWLDDDDRFAHTENLKPGATLEITLTPQGPLIDGSQGRAFVVRHKLENTKELPINNIPVGRYTLAVKMVYDGKRESLRIKENMFGQVKGRMNPKDTNDTATVIFRSESSDSRTLRVTGGNMERLRIMLYRVPNKTAD